jgi:hypothetical protein
MKSQKLLRKRKQMRMFCCKSRVTSGIVERAKASTFERAFSRLIADKKTKEGIPVKVSGGKVTNVCMGIIFSLCMCD